MATPPTLTVRTATADDADATRAIYNLEVETSTVTFDLRSRSSAEQRAWLAERSGALTVLVAEIAGEVAGFASLSQCRERPGYSTSVEDSVYVHRDHQGEGVGRVLLTGVVDAARASGFHAVFARIGVNVGYFVVIRRDAFAAVWGVPGLAWPLAHAALAARGWRPALMTITGFTRDAARAADMNFLASLIAST